MHVSELTRRAFGALAAAAFAVAAVPALAQTKPKVSFIYVGPVGDMGWSYQHHQGLEAIKKEFGDKIETNFVENVPEGPDAERVIDQLAATGSNLIFTTSFGFMNPTIKVATRYPNVKFEHATGFKQAANVATYNARFYEGRHVIGLIAGKLTKTNTIGYIASFPIPEVVMGINAAYLAAKSVNPNVKMKVVWVSTWFDPGKEADAAKAHIDQGCDIIVQHTDSPAALQVAQERDLMAFGQSSDMRKFAPDAQLTAIVDDWNGYYIGRVKAVLDGTWESQGVWLGLKDGTVEIAPYGPKVTPEAAKAGDEVKAAIISGSLHPFTGPITDRDGKERLAAGQMMSDEDLAKMDWYVPGVTA